MVQRSVNTLLLHRRSFQSSSPSSLHPVHDSLPFPFSPKSHLHNVHGGELGFGEEGQGGQQRDTVGKDSMPRRQSTHPVFMHFTLLALHALQATRTRFSFVFFGGPGATAAAAEGSSSSCFTLVKLPPPPLPLFPWLPALPSSSDLTGGPIRAGSMAGV